VDVEEFISLTVQMPGLRDVFNLQKSSDFIIIRNDLIHKIGTEKFQQCIDRLHLIMKSICVKVYLENIPGFGVKLHARSNDEYIM
jgi:hypothetical protein